MHILRKQKLFLTLNACKSVVIDSQNNVRNLGNGIIGEFKIKHCNLSPEVISSITGKYIKIVGSTYLGSRGLMLESRTLRLRGRVSGWQEL